MPIWPVERTMIFIAVCLVVMSAIASTMCAYEVGEQLSTEVAYAAAAAMIALNVGKTFALSTFVLTDRWPLRWCACGTAVVCSAVTGAAFLAWSALHTRPLLHPADELFNLAPGVSNSYIMVLAAFIMEFFPLAIASTGLLEDRRRRLQTA